MENRTKKFDFKNIDGETLSGRLELPVVKIRAYAIFAHCFTCSKSSVAATRISRYLSDRGIAVLRFDFTGLGNSEGDFSNTNFSSNVEDLYQAALALENEYEAPQIIIGHSFGGSAALKLSTKLESLKAVVTIGAPSDVKHVANLFKDQRDIINCENEAVVNLAGREFKIKKQFIDDLESHDFLEELGHTKKAYLLMHTPTDEIVSVDHAAKIYSALKHPKSFISLCGADHLISKVDDAKFVAQMIASWLDRYIAKQEDLEHHHASDVLVESRKGSKFTNDIYSKNHYLVADEPLAVKGDDLGMNPYELLLSALGACTSMTMRMYAEHKGFALEDIRVELTHEKKHIDDCETCEDGPKKLDHINKKITVTGDLTDEQKEKIIGIAKKCPVNRTLLSETIITEEH